MSDLVAIIIASCVTVITGLFTFLGHIHHFKSCCCSSDCINDDEEPSNIAHDSDAYVPYDTIRSRTDINSPLTIRRRDYHTSDI